MTVARPAPLGAGDQLQRIQPPDKVDARKRAHPNESAPRQLSLFPARREREPNVAPPSRLERSDHQGDGQHLKLHTQTPAAHLTLDGRNRERLRAQALRKVASDCFVTIDEGGRVLALSFAAEALFGYTEGELIGHSIQRLLPDLPIDDPMAPARSGTGSLPQAKARRLTGMRRDGTGFPVEGFLTRCDGSDALTVLMRDVSELDQKEAALRESETRLRELAEHTEDILCLFERKSGELAYANPALKAVTGRTADALRRSPLAWLRWVHREDRSIICQAIRNMLRGDPLDEDIRFLHADGSLRWCHVRVFPVEKVDGEVVRDIVVVRDITASRTLEEELRHAHKMEAVGTLATGVAHDFRNFLQGIAGCAHMALRTDGLPDKARLYLERITATVRRGSSLTNQLTAFAHRQTRRTHPMALDPAIAAATSLIEHLVGDHIRVCLDTNAPTAVVDGDPTVLQQILMNLARNAADAMPQGGTLTIETRHTDAGVVPRDPGRFDAAVPHVELIMRDTGTGMEPSVRERLFEPFFTTKAVGHGTGVGLAIVQELTHDLGGQISVSSEPGRGTEFRLVFPCTDKRPDEASAPDAKHLQLHGRVLLVDDDPLVRITLRCYLEELGLEVVDAHGARATSSVFATEKEPFDLIVSDVTMPELTGPRLVDELRRQDPSLRALFVSACDRTELCERGLLDPTAPFLRKPLEPEALGAAVAQILGPGSPASDTLVAATTVHAEVRPSPGSSTTPRNSKATIVLVEDNDAARLALQHLLEELDHVVLAAPAPDAAAELVRSYRAPIDLLLTDIRLPRTSGTAFASELRKSWPDMRVIFMSGLSSPPPGAEALFVRKPINMDVLTRYVEQALHDAPTHA